MRAIRTPGGLDRLECWTELMYPAPWGETVHCVKEAVVKGVTHLDVIGTYAPGNPYYRGVCEFMHPEFGDEVGVYTARDGDVTWRVSIAPHKPCPYCDEALTLEARELARFEGSDGGLVRTGSHWAVVCPLCGGRGPSAESEAEAWELWETGMHGEREDYAEAYRRVGSEVYRERLVREGVL